jgi:hypothetical protein
LIVAQRVGQQVELKAGKGCRTQASIVRALVSRFGILIRRRGA